jgi:hypothetical protein
MSRFHGYDPQRSEVEIGSVVFLVGPENIRSQRAVEKIGGVRFGSRPDAEGRESLAFRIESSAFAQRAD